MLLSLNCNGRLLVLDGPKIMGILNATPDSFYAASRVTETQAAVDTAGTMLEAGATFIDVGGMSSRPGAELITAAEEMERVLPIIEAISKTFPEAFVSCDTIYGATARAAVAHGAAMINDISAGNLDAELFPTLPDLRVPYVLMHMPGKPADMQQKTNQYGREVVTHVWDFLAQKLVELRESGVHDVLIDVGWGFGKTVAQNYELLANLEVFKQLDAPILVGVSRKSSIYKPLGISAKESLAATTALHLYALQRGADILRVHDVPEARQAIELYHLLREAPLV